ncbi:MAG: DUF3048 domain-containing protein [Patescibacteria group bacterium]|nr:DUF3048 domain-containing protein [Patescibacteria group bacterium]
MIKKNSQEGFDNYGKESDDIILDEVCVDSCQNRLIDGALVLSGEENPFLVSAVLDNHSDARPQFGLSRASLVYDVPAEGGINRYLAFFRSDLEGDFKIGPIRSARPYFLDISLEYQALMLHCGGSPASLARIIKEKLLTLNEFYNSYYFIRYDKYIAPHNVLADYQKIKEYLQDKNLSNSNFLPWKFKTKSEFVFEEDNFEFKNEKNNSEINIKNGQHQYDTKWQYNYRDNIYLKKISQEDQTDDSGEIISADNLILQFVDTKILDSELRLEIDLLGRGEAVICLDGFCQNGYWEKIKNSDRTIYYYDNNEELIFNIGKTWIHLIDEGTSVEIDNFSF